MDINKLLINVVNLDKYVQFSQDVAANFNNCTVQFNMSTVLFLNKMRTFEIEFFNKYGNNGAAIKIIELLLLLPPSSTWRVLGKDIISLLQYWLAFLCKHLIFKNNNWWSYLCTLLQFVKEIRLKESTLSNILVEETADTILSLATHDIPDISQKHKILCVFNLCGADCSREIRFALRTQFDHYFITLAKLLATCGDITFQYSIMETLLRWLLPRHNNNVRLEAAAKWFPDHLYNRKVVDLFLERPWQNFFQDARDFLNMHNECDDLITSVIINKLNIANVALVTGLEKRQHWLDINVGTKCLSFILDPFMVKLLGGSCEAISCETLVVSEDNTREAKLQRQTVDVVLSVTTINAPHMIPSSVSLTGDDYKHLEITISSKTDLTSFDKALRKIFADKFQESDTFFSRPGQLKTGCMVKSNNIRLNLSPSSASTSSLSKLHEKLAALPKVDYYKNRVSICAQPELSNVAEVTEAEDHNSSIASACTFKNRNYGVCQKSSLYSKEKEVRGEKEQQNNNNKCISPSETEQEPVSCLLVATIGSADESIIKDTLERLSKSKDCTTDNVLDLLVQESIQSKLAAIENDETGTEQSHKQNKLLREKVTNLNKTEAGNKCTVLSNSTSAEESNTGIVEGTQLSNVNFEKRGYRHRKNISTNNQSAVLSPVKTFDETAVEEFFSEHFAETRNGELIISPSLARKINETSSDSSEDFAECCFNENVNNEVMPDLEVIECLKFMVNKICDEFDQCEKMLNQDVENICKVTGLEENTIPEEINGNVFELVNEINEKNPVVSNKISVKPVILKFKTTHKPVRGKTVKKRLEPKGPTTKAPAPRKNIMKEKNSKNKVNVADAVENVKPIASEENTSLVRRKRKLYSPKTQHWNDDENVIQIAPDDNRSSKTKSKITCYTEIENVRNDYTKKLRNREPKKKVQPLSPRTKKNNELFDKLKEKTDCNEKIILVDKTNIHNDVAIYNFNSDSEDDDFKESKVKPTSTSARKNTDTTCVKNKPKCTKAYPAKKKNQSKSNNRIETPVRTVIDERMRDQPSDILNTSLKVEKPPQKRIRDSLLNLKIEHKMEVMDEDLNTLEQNITKTKVNKKKIKAKNAPTLKSDKKLKVSDILNETSDRTQSPLPGLVVERVHQNVDNSNDSLSAIMLSKFKQIYEKRREPIEGCLSTTQVLLSDHDDDERNEQHEFSPSPINYIATPRQLPQKEKPSPNKSVKEKRAEKYKKSYKNPNKIVSSIDVPNMDDSSNGERLNMSSCSKKDEEISFVTVGYSPITAHGDLEQCQNDLPPNREFLNQSIEPRNMEVDDLNQSIKEFFVQLNREIVKESGNKHGDVESNNSQSGYGNISPSSVKAKEYRLKSPILSFSRITSNDGTKGLPTNSGTGSDCNEESCYSKRTNGKAKDKANKTNKESKRSPQRRKFLMSQISPVKLFEDLKPATRRNSDASKSSDSDDEKHTKNIFYKRKPASPDESPKRSQSYWLRSNRDKRSSVESAVSSSTKKSPVKRKSSIESSQRTKSSRLEEGGVFRKKSDSCTFGTDLNDWFRSMKPTTSKVATLDGVFKENMTYVIEKLDTTVNEIHHNTDKRLINMFVEAQSQLDANKALRNSLYKSTAKELFADMVKLIDARFSDMNAKSDEMDRKFMAELKERARVIITDDCRKKKAIVRLLREDVQAVVDFINKEK